LQQKQALKETVNRVSGEITMHKMKIKEATRTKKIRNGNITIFRAQKKGPGVVVSSISGNCWQLPVE